MKADWATQIVIRHPERDELIALRDKLELPAMDARLNKLDRRFDKRWELTISIDSPEEFASLSERIAAIQKES
jgi:hypothetical protein